MRLSLVPLDCPSCGSALKGASHDILFLCSHCGSGAVLGDDGLEQIESSALLPPPGKQARRWLPAWLIEATVEVSDRVLANGGRSPGSKNDRTFVVPAFRLSLSELTQICKAFVRVSPALTEVPREPIRGGTLHRSDAETFIRHLVVGEEAAKPDKLASVSVTVEVKSARLAALPFEDHQKQLRCAITGQTVHVD